MKPFAKLFQCDEIGQVLVMLRLTGCDQPEIQLYFDPNVNGLGVSATKIEFPDTDAGSDAAQAAFDLIDEVGAIGAAKITVASIREIFAEEEAQ